MIKLTIPIEPVEQARPRATRKGAGIQIYDPPKVSKYKREIAKQARLLYTGEPLDGLTGVLWVDDNLIVSETSDKFYSDHPRVEVEVKELE